MSEHSSPPRINLGNFFLAWMATSLGFPFGGVVALSLSGPMEDVLSAALGGLITGTIVGALQWLVLRNNLGIDATWILATASGLALGNTVGIVLTGVGGGIEDLIIIGVAAGAAVGAGQWTLLRERLRLAGLWIPLLTIAWPLGWTTTWYIGVNISLGYTVFGAVGALVFAAITGAALLLMIRNLLWTPNARFSEKVSDDL